ncbi:MAG TPA: Clp protease N-terminal domain-containing protein [Acidimicrobiales bacterium]|nr:Clp protease N-terminal domain-containing protein [Acidimicrobiales bacterium]
MTELPDVAELAARVLDSAPPTGDSLADAMARLDAAEKAAAGLRERADQLVTYFVALARSNGASWTDIGRRLGVSRQAAQQRYSALKERATMTDLLNAIPRVVPPRAQSALRRAGEAARSSGAPEILPQHILLGILSGPGVAVDALSAIGVSCADLAGDVQATLPPASASADADVPMGDATRRLLGAALDASTELWHNYLGTEHLLLAMLTDDTVGPLLAARGAGADRLRPAIQGEIAKITGR